MHVFLFHLSWRQQFWNILGILFILFYFGLKFWKGLKSDESMQRQASQSSPFCQVITSDQKIDVYLHLFDISLSALGVT
jgi:hypothetical protein